MLYLISQIYNEEKRLKDWILPLLECVDRAYIIDDGSIDGTCKVMTDVLKVHSNTYFESAEHLGYDKHQMMLRRLAPEMDWMIRLDVDETIDPVDLLKIKMTHIPRCEELGYDCIEVTMKDYIDSKFIRDQHKRRIFRNEKYIIHPEKIHTEEVGFKSIMSVPEITIKHERTKKEVLEGTRTLLQDLKSGLDAFELTWHRTKEVGFGKEFNRILKDLSINVRV